MPSPRVPTKKTVHSNFQHHEVHKHFCYVLLTNNNINTKPAIQICNILSNTIFNEKLSIISTVSETGLFSKLRAPYRFVFGRKLTYC